MNSGKKLRRSRDNKVIFGVCGGIAESFNLNVQTVRMATAVLIVVFYPLLLAYIILGVTMPESSGAPAGSQGRKAPHQPGRPPSPQAKQPYSVKASHTFKESYADDVKYSSDDCGTNEDGAHVGRRRHSTADYSEEEYFKEAHRMKKDDRWS